MAEDVALAEAPALGGEDVAARHVPHVHDVEAGVDEANILPRRKSTIIWPVGVGFTSHGPTGADGFTMTTGAPRAANSRATSSARNFDAL